MRLGIYMGSFNPPLKGHEKVINYLLDNKYVDNILVVPTLSYWDKDNLASLDDRINMLKFYENEKVIIDTLHNKFIYTIELIEALEEKYPDTEFYIIIGADNIIHFDKWKNYKELLKYHFIVMNRDNIDIDSYLEKLGSNNFIVLNDYPFISISSTEIRNNLNEEYLNPKVYQYIKKRKLY